MTIDKPMNVGAILRMNAIHYPHKLGWQDKRQEFTFIEWNERSCRLSNALKSIGVGCGDSFAVLSYNRGEWMDIFAGCAKGGQIVVPIMFRSVGPDIEYIISHSECKAFVVEAPFVELVNSIKDKLPVPRHAYIYLGDGPVPDGYIGYDNLLSASSKDEPNLEMDDDTWMIMYTSGTTGRPKGVVRTHRSHSAQHFLNNINMGVRPTDKAMLVMPMCHINSIFYSFPYTLVSAPVFIYNMTSFDPEDLLRTIAKYQITFTSLVPTHYIMMLELSDSVRASIDVSSVRQLLISSAPAEKELKLAIMNYFNNAELWEAYGSTEAGLVTLLRPEEQFQKLGSIGREIFGIDTIRIRDENGKEVQDGEVGELFFRTPMCFKEYWKDTQKTADAFDGDWCSVGDMVRRDQDGYYTLVDRKDNMIITGGENVYPSEIEDVIRCHSLVKDVAVVGVPDRKWGETVKAIVVSQNGCKIGNDLAKDIIDFCRGKLAGYKRPKSVDFIEDHDMPRTPTGKVLHRVLREKYGKWGDLE